VSKIYLSPENASSLGEDTFWTWFDREVENSEWYNFHSDVFSNDNALLRYSTFGEIGADCTCQTFALCWELLPEMRSKLGHNVWDHGINLTYQCAVSAKYRVVATPLSIPYYKHCGPVDVLPIAVDTDLFRPMSNKEDLRQKHQIPQDKKVGFWMGTSHQMKGFENLKRYASDNPDIHWIIVWKSPHQRSYLAGATECCYIPQQHIAELMNCSDFFLVCGLLSPYFMIEYEAMACNLPMLNITDLEKDFDPGENPRDKIFELGWDRKSALGTWKDYLGNRGVDVE
jgi:glycosyltransferase involved in cell wall biosynthesis